MAISSAHGFIGSRTTSYTLTLPEEIPDGAWMILILNQSATYPGGMGAASWTQLLAPTQMNTRRVAIHAKIKSGDTSVTISWATTSCQMAWMVLWGTGKPINEWQIGGLELRDSYGSPPRNWARCPSVTVTDSNATAVAIAFEATNSVESPDSVLSYNNGFTEIAYRPQGAVNGETIETIWAGEKDVTSGATGITTVLYRNAQDSNGAGIHIIIPQDTPPPEGTSTPVVVSTVTSFGNNANSIVFDTTALSALVQNGDIIVAALRSQTTASSIDWTSSGFVRIGPAFLNASADQRVTGLYRRAVNPGDIGTSLTFGGLSTLGRVTGVVMLIRGEGAAVEVDSFYDNSLGQPISNGRSIPSFTTTRPNTLLVFMGANEIVSPHINAPTTMPAGFTERALAVTSTDTGISRTVAWTGTREQITAGATAVADIAWTYASSAVAFCVALYAPPNTGMDPTLQLEKANGDLVNVRSWNGTDEVAISQALALPKTSFTVSEMDTMIANDELVYWSHRGGSANWPEMTMRAYTNSIWHGALALEVSVHRSSDGVWIMSHDSTLTRVTASTHTISSTTSSTLLGIPVDTPTTGGVIGRLEDILSTYSDYVLLIDNKPGSYFSSFLDLLETIPDATEHIIVKLDGQYAPVANFQAAQSRGFKTCGYWYPNNYAANLPSRAAYCDYIGMQFDATSGEWTDVLSYGKPVWGHVCQNQTQANLCIAGGASIIQCANVIDIIPQRNIV